MAVLGVMDLSAERSEDGASGRYTAPWGSEWCQNHCSNHSGFVTGADTFVRTTLGRHGTGKSCVI